MKYLLSMFILSSALFAAESPITPSSMSPAKQSEPSPFAEIETMTLRELECYEKHFKKAAETITTDWTNAKKDGRITPKGLERIREKLHPKQIALEILNFEQKKRREGGALRDAEEADRYTKLLELFNEKWKNQPAAKPRSRSASATSMDAQSNSRSASCPVALMPILKTRSLAVVASPLTTTSSPLRSSSATVHFSFDTIDKS